ncbi:hypothetical protein ABZV91_13055 [Nocardia sp. NPDC004568]|uniref:hypothetical protein n=1 Tax=Nocardia sp. NPDC004568 TaxID=3154551 RepID=UPI0033B764E4
MRDQRFVVVERPPAGRRAVAALAADPGRARRNGSSTSLLVGEQLSRSHARDEIATLYGSERRSTDGKYYRDYLMQYWNDHWDRWEKLRTGGS